MIDLNEVAIFLSVVENGGFSAAARALGLPKATVSRKVANLEASLGVRLLQRTTRAINLTDAGRRYHRDCRGALAAVEEATHRLAGTQGVPSGTIRISAPADAAHFFVADTIAGFAKAYPGVGIELVLTDEQLNLVEQRIDVAFRTGRLKDSSLIARKLGEGQRMICASPAYLDVAGTPRLPADLGKHAAIVHGDSIEGASWTLIGPKGKVVVRLQARLAANSMALVLKAAVAGLGLALLPEPVAAAELRRGRLKTVMEAWRPPAGGISLVYPSNRHVSAATRAFIDFAVKSAPDIGLHGM
ncbi:MAG TPA: LysR family transcriptional regulator [Bauldia sp.]|nr:LysR family transcriptional regulator [Bauldia sp.]